MPLDGMLSTAEYDAIVAEVEATMSRMDRQYIERTPELTVRIVYGRSITVVYVNRIIIPGLNGRLAQTRGNAESMVLSILEARPDATVVEQRV